MASVRSEGLAPNAWNWPLNGKIHYSFRGTSRTDGATLPVTWYDGTSKPPAEIIALIEGDEWPDAGSIMVGTQGVLLVPHENSRPALYPSAKFKDFKLPQIKGGHHWTQFVEACQGRGKTAADFSYAGPLTEAILLGNIASRFPQTTLEWNAPGMRFSLSEANQYLRRDYRAGWSVKGLS